MTDFRLERFPFDAVAVNTWIKSQQQAENWPVVYTLSSHEEIYVGETVNASTRMFQHLSSSSKSQLEMVQVIVNSKFNKSACLDLESHLIRYFAADGKLRVLNGNFGIQDSDYFDRDEYRKGFEEVFKTLVDQGLLTRSIPEIVNSNLFKFSPFKSLNSDQALAVSALLDRLLDNYRDHKNSQLVIQGDPGTGKTIVAIYLIKLLVDIGRLSGEEILSEDSIFSEFFSLKNQSLLSSLKVGLVVPQQSLRKTLQLVFHQTPGLAKTMVMTPFEVGESNDVFDLLIVDEAHRLGQRANQSSAALNKKYSQINVALFGEDSISYTQLDWIRNRSKSQVLLMDTNQSVRPADLPLAITEKIVQEAQKLGNLFPLTSQMRVQGGNDYLDFVKALFSSEPVTARDFEKYDLRFFEDFAEMKTEISAREREHGLSRLVAGFAWPWNSKNDPTAVDIEIQGLGMQWNGTAVDWINSATSIQEVGSIHTVQGYDLNYAGVIIGEDLTFDPIKNQVRFVREKYFDAKGKENNPTLGLRYTDEDLLTFVVNIYKVLLTRGIRGTYVFVADDNLRRYLRPFFGSALPETKA
ncbi:MAG: hypothetical protein RL384_195 [Actinomycetota bacterium]|jgi:DUF2075 family protein